jgi:uncharacterized protein (DUF952 family)
MAAAGKQYVYRIMTSAEWRAAKTAKRYAGSKSEKKAGVIHLSTAQQLRATYERRFRDQHDLVAVAFVADELAKHQGGRLVWQKNERLGEAFPNWRGAYLPVEAPYWERAHLGYTPGDDDPFLEFP